MNDNFVYLVHMYKKGVYFQTSSIAFKTRKSAIDYADELMFEAHIEKVELAN